MNEDTPKKRPPTWPALLACVVLGFTSLGIALYETSLLVELLDKGQRAEGVVAGIEKRGRSGKKAILEFPTSEGQIARTYDIFFAQFIQHEVGDEVTVLYDPEDLDIATIDMGIWTWQSPGVFYGGFLLLLAAYAFILRDQRKRDLR